MSFFLPKSLQRKITSLKEERAARKARELEELRISLAKLQACVNEIQELLQRNLDKRAAESAAIGTTERPRATTTSHNRRSHNAPPRKTAARKKAAA